MSRNKNSARPMSGAEKEAVAPGRFQIGFTAKPGSFEYETLLASLNNRSDRDWWPEKEPEHFICKAAPGKWKTKNHAWFPVFDGVAWEWSYLKGFKNSVLPTVSQAARYEVESQVESLRVGGFHVHHDGVAFSALFDAFVECFGLSKDEILLEIGEKSGEVWFQNPYFSLFWRLFHAENATLKLISVAEHKRTHSVRGQNK